MITTETDTASIASPSPTAIEKKRYTNLSICINKMYLKTLIDRINTSKIYVDQFYIYSLPLSLSRQASKSSLLQSKLNLSVGSGNSEQRGSKSSPGSPASLSYRSYNSANTGSDSEGHRQGTGNHIVFHIKIFRFVELYNVTSLETNFELVLY